MYQLHSTHYPLTILQPKDAQQFIYSNLQLAGDTLNELVSDNATLTAVLLRHVIQTRRPLFSEDFAEGSKLYPTLGGEFVTVTKVTEKVATKNEDDAEEVTNKIVNEDDEEDEENEEVEEVVTLKVTSSLGEAKVKMADVEADNGVVHIIDGIL